MSASAVLRRRLGVEMRGLRVACELAQEDVAARLEISTRTIQRMEAGETAVAVRDLRAILGVYRVSPDTIDRLVELGRQARQRGGWWSAYRDLMPSPYIELESAAALVRGYEHSYLPGLLQTEEYARATISTLPGILPEEVDRRVAARLKRQDRLTGDDPLNVQMVLDEAVLHRLPGSIEVMDAQLRHLLHLANLRNVELNVLPFHRGVYPAMGHAFTMLIFPHPMDPPMVLVEHITGERVLDRGEEVGMLEGIYQELSALSRSADDTKITMQDMREHLVP